MFYSCQHTPTILRRYPPSEGSKSSSPEFNTKHGFDRGLVHVNGQCYSPALDRAVEELVSYLDLEKKYKYTLNTFAIDKFKRFSQVIEKLRSEGFDVTKLEKVVNGMNEIFARDFTCEEWNAFSEENFPKNYSSNLEYRDLLEMWVGDGDRALEVCKQKIPNTRHNYLTGGVKWLAKAMVPFRLGPGCLTDIGNYCCALGGLASTIVVKENGDETLTSIPERQVIAMVQAVTIQIARGTRVTFVPFREMVIDCEMDDMAIRALNDKLLELRDEATGIYFAQLPSEIEFDELAKKFSEDGMIVVRDPDSTNQSALKKTWM